MDIAGIQSEEGDPNVGLSTHDVADQSHSYLRRGEATMQMLPPSVDPRTANQKTLDRMQSEMVAVLNSNLPTDQKMLKYNDIFQKYVELKTDTRRPILPSSVDPGQVSTSNTVAQQPSETVANPYEEFDRGLVSMLPKNVKAKGAHLLRLIRSPHSNISYSPVTGKVSLNGREIPGAHIGDLLSDVLVRRKQYRALGVDSFMRGLADSNVPDSLISNTERRGLLQTLKRGGPPSSSASGTHRTNSAHASAPRTPDGLETYHTPQRTYTPGGQESYTPVLTGNKTGERRSRQRWKPY